MLAFFRRIVNSKVGVIVTFGILILIALAFAAGDVTGLRSSGGGGLIGGGSVARVGAATVTPADLRARVQAEVESYRQQQPGLDMATFVNGGGIQGALERLVTGLSYQEFAQAAGLVVSKRLVDSEIAAIPGLQGLDGKFDPALYQRVLYERKLTDAQVRTDVARDIIGQQLLAPTASATGMPEGVALPYASLLLERRAGQVALVPVAATGGGPAPTDAELQAFYRRNLSRYGVPERRVVRYAMVTPDQLRAAAAPTDAEVAQAYQANPARYAPSEKRTVTQVVVADRAGADRLAASVRGGTTIAAAARAAGLEPSTRTGVDKASYASTASAAAADAVFAAAKGAVVGPVRGAIGFVVAQVDGVEQVPGRTLEQARGEIAAALGKQKLTEALGQARDRIDDALAGNATFDEVVGDRKLQARATPPLTASGIDPDNPNVRPDPTLAPVLQAGFQSAEGDAPQLVAVGPDGGFAVVALGRIVPAAPRPLAQVRDRVAQDFTADRARQAARRIAGQIVAKVNRGLPLAQAIAQAGVPLQAPRPISAARGQIAQAPQNAQAPLELLFATAANRARLAPAPDGSGWMIVRAERIEAGDASRNPGLVRAARADLGRLTGREYAEQFSRAIRATVGVKTDAGALARLRAELLGQGQSDT